MSRYRLQRGAKQDLRDIYRYIAQYNEPAATRLYVQFLDTFRFLAANPLMGELRPDLAPDLRSFVHRNYVIVYRPERGGVSIIKVAHAARDLRSLF